MKYRADIDGLRSVAIIPVVLYHAGISMFSGGFVGVDVFFVISGYLITSIILNDIDKDKFTITNFYFRRVKRIFPALYFYLAITTAACFMLYLPADFSSYAKSLIGTVFFVSNIVFWQDNGYFAVASELKPLLHTWSLSVEEQFYIFYPVMLLILAKYFRKKYIPAVLLVFVTSFILSIVATPTKASASFFLLPTRAWELMLGALLAFNFLPKTSNIRVLNLLSLAGISLIMFSIFNYDSSTLFPGLGAVIPCAGTAFIIYSGSTDKTNTVKPLVNKLMSLKPLVIVGLVSYSWYLWHWGMFSFRHYFKNVFEDSFFLSNSFIIFASFFMAYLSFFVIEKPFRNIEHKNLKPLFSGALAFMIIFSVTGFYIVIKDGMKDRLPPRVLKLAETYEKHYKKSIIFRDLNYLKNNDIFILGDKSVEPSFILLGDSHAWTLAPGIDKLASANGKSGLLYSMNACPPVLGAATTDRTLGCLELNETAYNRALNDSNIKTFILLGRWHNYLNDTEKLVIMNKDKHERVPASESKSLFIEKLDAMIAGLTKHSIKTVIFSSIPESPYDVLMLSKKKEFAKTVLHSGVVEIDMRPRKVDFTKMQERAFLVFNSLVKYGTEVIYLDKPLCDDEFCEISGDELYYFDDDHLLEAGADYVCDKLSKEIIAFF
jgi:peptidoglycan/LPS O-acetylase OafA/YrhL